MKRLHVSDAALAAELWKRIERAAAKSSPVNCGLSAWPPPMKGLGGYVITALRTRELSLEAPEAEVLDASDEELATEAYRRLQTHNLEGFGGLALTISKMEWVPNLMAKRWGADGHEAISP